jgi:hypothetical protein
MRQKMTRPNLFDSAGPGSSISLAPETLRIRDALIEKFIGEPLDEMNKFLSSALDREKDEERRLGILAARIYILRHRVQNLKDFERDKTVDKFQEVTPTSIHASLPTGYEDSPIDTDDPIEEDVNVWFNIKMTEPGEINGVRFFEGTIINAKKIDADRLIDAGKAALVDEMGNEIDLTGIAEDEKSGPNDADQQQMDPETSSDEERNADIDAVEENPDVDENNAEQPIESDPKVDSEVDQAADVTPKNSES